MRKGGDVAVGTVGPGCEEREGYRREGNDRDMGGVRREGRSVVVKGGQGCKGRERILPRGQRGLWTQCTQEEEFLNNIGSCQRLLRAEPIKNKLHM